MEPVKPETLAAIKADEFARSTIEAAIEMLYVEGRDWEHINRRGKVLFHREQTAIAYAALCSLVGRTEPPDVDGKVNVGGVMIEMDAITQLERAFVRRAEEK